jgi:hypothetical protein
MAIKKKVELENNFGEQSVIDCYIRIASVTLHKNKARAVISLMSSDISKLVEQDVVEFECNDSLPNVWAQTYSQLKKLSKYSGAEDC